jgi:gamma-glutamyltranspeptidase / glutathione hydrolase
MFTTRPELLGTYGMVASTHWLASASGMSVLEAGGNAFDAAVTAGFVLQVVEPHLNGPAGEAPIIFSTSGSTEVRVIDGQGPAPAAASIQSFAALDLEVVPGTGFLAAVVPGAFDAWLRLLLEHGTWRIRDVLQVAIGYAERGYPLVPRIPDTIGSVEQLFRDEWPTSAQLYLRDGVPRPGTLFRNRDLAATYRKILTEAEARGSGREAQIQGARDAFYRGFVAEAIAKFLSSTQVMDTSGRRHGGLLNADDLARHESSVEAALGLEYHNHTVWKAAPWSQGPVLLQQLALLDGYDLAAMGHNSADYIHTIVECAKLAFADREAWYGDPAFVDVPIETLLDPSYAAERRALVGEAASYDLRPGAPGGRQPQMATVVAQTPAHAGAGEPTIARTARGGAPLEGDTCHVDVVDRHGNLVSATPSGGWLQSSPVVPGLGFPLTSRAQMFWLTEGLPNSLEPGKRPRTTLTPSLAHRDGEPYLAFGTPGGDQQDQWQLMFLLAHLHFGMDLQAAIDAPTFHTTHFPASFYPRTAHPGQIVVEERIDPGTIAALRERGHKVLVDGPWSLGRVSAAGREPSRGLLKAAANARGMQGYAVGR